MDNLPTTHTNVLGSIGKPCSYTQSVYEKCSQVFPLCFCTCSKWLMEGLGMWLSNTNLYMNQVAQAGTESFNCGTCAYLWWTWFNFLKDLFWYYSANVQDRDTSCTTRLCHMQIMRPGDCARVMQSRDCLLNLRILRMRNAISRLCKFCTVKF